MPGLPGDSKTRFLVTTGKVVRLHPDMVRLYPVIVIEGTELAEWYKAGDYKPVSMEEALEICELSCMTLEEQGIPVIRIGLMSSSSLLEDGQILAGPWHTAFGFLVRSRIHQKLIEPSLPKPGEASKIGLRAQAGSIPLIRGYKNMGVHMIEERTGSKIEYVKPDASISFDQVGVDFL
jgi:histone acetyltransferase (RNA polymerase elongator complex component)